MTAPGGTNPFRAISRIRRMLLRLVAGPLGIAFLVFGIANIGPAWTAHSGGGAPGTFTAVHEACVRGSCTWFGNFRPSADGPTRTDVSIASGGRAIHAAGDSVAAVDTGANNVFPAGGGNEWLLRLLLLAIGPGLIVVWFFTTLRPAWRWWRRRRERRASAAVRS